MICYFYKNETNFTHNGLGVLDDYIISPVVTEEINGIFKLEFDYPTHANHGNGLIPERIVRCPVPNMPDQLFRIAEREAAIGGIFHVVAYHVFYDLAQNLIEDTFIINKNGAQAMAQLLGATQFNHGFTSSSNIGTYNNARMVRLNAAEAILDGGTDNSFMSRWGGEIIRDNFFISMQTVRGSNNGVCIRDKKNLTGYRSNVDFGTVVTRIMPQGYDGLFLPEKYVDSPYIGNYQTPRIRILKYDKVKAITGNETGDPPEDAVPLPEAYAMLRTLAAKEYSDNHIDIPAASYKVEFAPLERTEEYKNFTALETINIGDTVKVIHEEDGLDISARMISYTYDPLVKAYIAVNLGNAEPKFTSAVSEMRSVAVDAVQKAAENGLIVLPSAGNDRAVNYYGSAEPPNPHVGDLWFKENGDKLELWIYETRDGVTQWYALLSDLMFEEMRQELAAAAAEVEDAKAKAQEALEAGEAAAIAGAEAKAAAEEAAIAGAEALAAGQDALAAGAEALAAGQAAQSTADQAVLDAREAVSRANQAFDDAISALNAADSAAGLASDAYDKSVKATAVSYVVSSSGVTAPTSGWQSTIPSTVAGQFLWTRTVITLQNNSTITSYSVAKHGETGIAGSPGAKGDTGATGAAGAKGADAPTITAVREQYYLSTSQTSQSGGSWSDTVPTWVSGRYYWTRVAATYSDGSATYSTPVLAEGLNNSLITVLEAKTNVQTLQTTVSQHATSISLNASNITSLTTRISTAEASLTVQAGQITLKANQTTVDTLTGRVTAAESTILQHAEFINLRVSKNDVINQINISTEGILIAGNKIRITGQTAIDNAVIQTAMIADLAVSSAKIANLAVATGKIADLAVSTAKIADLAVSTAKIANAAITNAKIGNLAVNTAQIADAAITDAKIANLSAAKITTGTLSSDRIAAGSITSAKLTIANGYIINAMIADATIQSVKIAAIDAGKITTGTLAAARIGAGTITADKMVTNFLQTLTGTSSIRITGTTISYYNGSALTSQINANGFELTRDNVKIGRIGTNNFSGQPTWRGLVFDLEYSGRYMAWAWKETSTATAYTVKLCYYRSKLQDGQEKGFHFDEPVYFKGGLSAASGSSTVTNTIAYSTFNTTNCLCRHTTNFKAGVALGGSSLILGSSGTWVNFNTIRAICALLAGKTVYLPAGVNSSGGTLSSWWQVSFPSMTTWST